MQWPLYELGLFLKDAVNWLLHRRRRVCLLVVEDDEYEAELLRLRIEKLGWECDVVESTEAAMPLLLTRRHRVVLMDMRLPHAPGYVLAERIHRHLPRTHIVIVAGELSDLSPLPRGVYYGLIGKPATPEALLDIFRKPEK